MPETCVAGRIDATATGVLALRPHRHGNCATVELDFRQVPYRHTSCTRIEYGVMLTMQTLWAEYGDDGQQCWKHL
jgi:hypothetical protein